MTPSNQAQSSAASLRPSMAGSALSASLATGMMLFGGGKAAAQETPPPPADEPIQLGPVRVGGDEQDHTGPNVLRHGTKLDRLPGDLQDTPQTVTVIPQVIIQQQQQATTIDQVLKYVPGVTVATGEGNGGMNGDAFRIRGFDAKGDLYVDGLRDFGAYVRDNFAVEGVQVFKGSSSESFGNGSTGGVINQVSKTAHLGDSSSLTGTLGSGPQKRVVADLNKQISDTTALRLVGMWHDQDLVDRDHIYSKRWGVLGSLGFGLGTDQTLTINYMHQHGDRRPDMGVPSAQLLPGTTGYSLPVTELGVPRSNNFGKETDQDLTNVDMGTVRYHKQVAYVSKNNVPIWTTYDVATLIPGLPGKLLVGGGLNYRSRYFADPNMIYLIPAAATMDGLISWENDRFRVALNVTNLTNTLTYASAFYWRDEPVPGRTFTGTVGVKF
jgi:catecholate siderophore receptor